LLGRPCFWDLGSRQAICRNSNRNHVAVDLSFFSFFFTLWKKLAIIAHQHSLPLTRRKSARGEIVRLFRAARLRQGPQWSFITGVMQLWLSSAAMDQSHFGH